MNFDELIDRNEYPTMKWSKVFLAEHFGNAAAIPMSVADMDFRVPEPVIEKLQERVAHGIFGYELEQESYTSALESWFLTRYAWIIDREYIEPCPSILNAISILVNQHSSVGDGVIIQPPVFFEFRNLITSNDRRIVKNPLKLIGGQYLIDFDDLEIKAADPNNKILILCNPHNPIGRVWTKTELTQLSEICVHHDVFVISDEIHCDFAFPPHRYIPYLTISESASKLAAACISPAKTFNIPGIVDAITIIPNEAHRHKFHEFTHRYLINKINVFTSVAVEGSYRDGAEWLDELIIYLKGNVQLVGEFLQENAVNISLIEPEGTFLVWLDFRGLGMDVKALEMFLAKKAKLALAPGYWFGREGAGFARMTIGCPRATLQRALDNLAVVVKEFS